MLSEIISYIKTYLKISESANVSCGKHKKIGFMSNYDEAAKDFGNAIKDVASQEAAQTNTSSSMADRVIISRNNKISFPFRGN